MANWFRIWRATAHKLYDWWQAEITATLIERHVDIGLAKDSSRAGAALCVSVAHKQNVAK
ncbi:hypothetical protein OG21DRAFT_1491160 [Imleria badia]|nr:hypothetical protein OG21DRAFT_1491160 [Imleria badia]